jgi:hypothetical protein
MQAEIMALENTSRDSSARSPQSDEIGFGHPAMQKTSGEIK